MRSFKPAFRATLSLSAAGLALVGSGQALAQEAQSEELELTEVAPSEEETIVVTGSRIRRAGFDQPTPTTVVTGAELMQGSPVNIQQALNDLPQLRNSVSANQSIANTTAGTAPVELRGLGTQRTLTLVNGRRFVGDNNLNFVPANLLERVEIVTGGASAAWGSGAVAGVVNLILDDDFDGLKLGAQTGISDRGDGARYQFDGAFGTDFADGRGHFMIGAEYVHDKGIGPSGRRDRPWYGAGLVSVGNGQLELQPDVDNLVVAPGIPITLGGTIFSGSLAGQVFDPDGSLRPAQDRDFRSLYDNLIVGSPLDRIGSYARATYDIGGATLWADVSYGRSKVDQFFLPDPGGSVLAFAVMADNPYLEQSVQDRLAAAGEPFFLLARLSADAFPIGFIATRETIEGAIGIEGEFGGGWEYDAHYSHGEVDTGERLTNSAISANFARAIDAVEANGAIVCRVNADADPANDDPSCAPFNPFGNGAPSAEARAYTTGTQRSDAVSKLDAAAVRVQGDLFNLPAGPLSVAFGAEARWEEQDEKVGELDAASAFATPLYPQALSGGFNVKEGFVEALVPIVKSDGLEVDFNGAARYSDYSLSGGIWSWKLGGTTRLFNDLLLRATRSRDIRAPNVGELFSQGGLNIRPIVDLDTGGRNDPNYNPNPTARVISGGNPDLVPEVSETLILGGSYTPSFAPGLQLSVDYYDISINRAIATVTPSDITAACAAGDQVACDAVVRDATGTITDVFATSQNLAKFETSGFDIEASYRIPQFAGLPGMMSFRALATYVDKLVTKTGTNTNDTAGDVGDAIAGLPNWRANFDIDYITEDFSLNARARYVGGGDFNDQLDIVNGKISARTYIDLGAEFSVMDDFTLFGNVRNLFDKDPPLVTTTYNAHYDVVGRFFTVGGRVNF